MKHKNLILLFALLCSVLSCTNDGIDNSYQQEEDADISTTTLAVLREQIGRLGTKRWDKNNYDNKLESIKRLSESENMKRGLEDTLNYVYTQVVIKEINSIISNECNKDNRQRLDSAVSELQYMLPSVKDKLEVEAKAAIYNYNRYLEILQFVDTTMKKLQTPKRLDEKYDENFEREIRTKAEEFINSGDVKCEYFLKKLQNPDFKRRRKHYCNTLVNIYCNGTCYDSKKETELRSRLKDVYRLDSVWENKINDFKEKHKLCE